MRARALRARNGLLFLIGKFLLAEGVVWTSGRLQWNVTWHKSQNFYRGNVAVHVFDEASGERLRGSEHDGWHPQYEMKYMLGRQKKQVGLEQVLGDHREYRNSMTKGLQGFTAVIREQEWTEVYCRGAKSVEEFFGDAKTRRQVSLADRNACVEECFMKAGGLDANFSRPLLNEAISEDCTVPLTHATSFKAVNTVADRSPTSSVRLPFSAFSPRTGMRVREEDIVDVLMVVDVASLPVLHNQTYTRDIKDVIVIDPESYPGDAPPQMKNQGARNWQVNWGETRGYGLDNRISRVRQDGSSPADPTYANHVPQLPWLPYRRAGLTRPFSNYHGEHRFAVPKLLQMPRFKAAATINHAPFENTAFVGAAIPGHFNTDIEVVEALSQHRFVIDVTPIVKKLLPTERVEFALLSNGGVAAFDETVVMHVAKQWMYPVQKPDSCPKQLSRGDCERAGCDWCTLQSKADDFLDLEWLDFAGQAPTGRCGVPIYHCRLRGGIPVPNPKLSHPD